MQAYAPRKSDVRCRCLTIAVESVGDQEQFYQEVGMELGLGDVAAMLTGT